MKLFTAKQIREWDNYSMSHEPVESIKLMERAAAACFHWITTQDCKNKKIFVFCGRGNNGGDGLAICRLLAESGYDVSLYFIKGEQRGSDDFEANLLKVQLLMAVHAIDSEKDLPLISSNNIIIDALFGTGLKRNLQGVNESVVNYINSSRATIISVDIPSGMFSDRSSKGNNIIKASFTLTFQQYKIAMLVSENAEYTGKIIVLDIGLDKKYYQDTISPTHLIDKDMIRKLYRLRKDNSHKGTFGHTLMIAGSYGMMGAAVLATRAAIRIGAGKVTAGIPEAGYTIMQVCVPEALSLVLGKKYIKKIEPSQAYSCIGIGPGIGIYESHRSLLQTIFNNYSKPIVIDADALNVLAEAPELLNFISPHSLLTPHPKEFEKLFGKTENDFDKLRLAISKAKQYNIFIILKGHHTFIACPDGEGYFNSTGNAGMATGGSGDVLTGILAGLPGQGYDSKSAAILGIYIHGLAGDIAAKNLSQEAMNASDIIDHIGAAFLQFAKIKKKDDFTD